MFWRNDLRICTKSDVSATLARATSCSPMHPERTLNVR